jgi:hypothetical protein
MILSIHIPGDRGPVRRAGDRSVSIGASDRSGEASSSEPTLEETCELQKQGETPEPPEAGAPATAGEPAPGPRRKRIFLLLALALMAAPIARAAMPPAVTPLDEPQSWETYVHRTGYRSYHPLLAGPVGACPVIWSSPTAAPSRPIDCRIACGVCSATKPCACSLALGLDLATPALTLRGQVASVPIPGIRIGIRRLARARVAARGGRPAWVVEERTRTRIARHTSNRGPA